MLRTAFAAAALLASTSLATALEEGTITIWMSADKGATQLQAVADRFTEELGIPVVIESPEPIPDKFPQAAATGDGPDVVLWAHDRFGEWAASGLLAPIDMGESVRSEMPEIALDAVTFNGETWAWPISLEAVALIYNKALVELNDAAGGLLAFMRRLEQQAGTEHLDVLRATPAGLITVNSDIDRIEAAQKTLNSVWLLANSCDPPPVFEEMDFSELSPKAS